MVDVGEKATTHVRAKAQGVPCVLESRERRLCDLPVPPTSQQLPVRISHPVTQRIARASARVFIGEEAYGLVASNLMKKV